MTTTGHADLSGVREIVRRVLECQDFPGRDGLLAQVPHITAIDGPVTMIKLRLSGASPIEGAGQGFIPNGGGSVIVMASRLAISQSGSKMD